MPLVLADRVRETTTTTGTGTISLAGPVSGFQGFSTAIGDANTTYYTIVDAATGAWEVGLGTYTSSGSTLARTTVLSSSNSDALVPFGAGTKDVFVTQPAERAVYVLGAGTGLAAGAAAFTSGGVPYADSTSTLATSSNLTFNGTTLTANALTTTSTVTINGGTANGVAYLNGSKVLTTGSALTFDGSTLGVSRGTAGTAASFAAGGQTLKIYGDSTSVSVGAGGALAYGTTSTFYDPTNLAQIYLVNNSEQMRLTSTGLGIGTSAPASKLHVNAASGSVFAQISSGANDLYLGYDGVSGMQTMQSDTGIYFATGASFTERMRLDSSGNLGIGTSSPATKLELNGATSAQTLTFGVTGSNSGARQVGVLAYRTAAVGATKFIDVNVTAGFDNFYDLRFYTDAGSGTPAERMRLDSSGNLGIGTSSPGAKLDVNGQIRAAFASGFQVDNAGTMLGKLYYSGGLILDRAAATNLLFQQNSSTQMLLNSSGNLGLGVTPSAWKSNFKALMVNTQGAAISGRSDNQSLNLSTNWYEDSGGADRYINSDFASRYLQFQSSHRWYTAPSGTAGNAITFTQAMTLDASGNLGVGTTSPADAQLTTVVSVNAASGYCGFRVLSNGTAVGRIVGSSGNEFRIDSLSTNPLTFYTNGSERARIDSSGNLLVGTTGTSAGAKLYVLGSGASNTVARFYNPDLTDGNPTLYIDKASTTTTTSQMFIGFTVNAQTAGSGQINANGASQAAFGSFSDARLKENIVDLEPQLEKVMALRPVEFDYKDGSGHQTGFVAQEMQQVYPDAIGEQNGFLTVTGYGKTEARLVKAIQELKADLDATKAELAALKGA
jgi:hypothetical protein